MGEEAGLLLLLWECLSFVASVEGVEQLVVWDVGVLAVALLSLLLLAALLAVLLKRRREGVHSIFKI